VAATNWEIRGPRAIGGRDLSPARENHSDAKGRGKRAAAFRTSYVV